MSGFATRTNLQIVNNDQSPPTPESAAAIRDRRTSLRLSRQQLAGIADCSMSSLYSLENAIVPARSRTLARILATLDRLESAASTEVTS